LLLTNFEVKNFIQKCAPQRR